MFVNYLEANPFVVVSALVISCIVNMFENHAIIIAFHTRVNKLAVS